MPGCPKKSGGYGKLSYGGENCNGDKQTGGYKHSSCGSKKRGGGCGKCQPKNGGSGCHCAGGKKTKSKRKTKGKKARRTRRKTAKKSFIARLFKL